MQVHTKLKIKKPASTVFEALVNPAHMKHYWFSYGSGRWEPGKTITLRYDEYNAEGTIDVTEVEANRRIVFQWGPNHTVTMTLTPENESTTIIEVNEAGWKETDPDLTDQLVDNKEGWVYMLTCLKAYLEHGITDLRASLPK